MTTFTASDPKIAGNSIDFSGESPVTFRYPIIIGDDFSRQITLNRVGYDYTDSSIAYWVKNDKPPLGSVVYTDTVAIYGVVIPVLPTDVGVAKFDIIIPATITATLEKGKLYGATRITYGDNIKRTLFLLELNITPV